MTREQLFLSNFETQFKAHMGSRKAGLEIDTPIATGDLPGFEVLLGETTFFGYDSAGSATQGEQQFALRIIWSHPQLHLDDRLADRSDLIGMIEAFFGGVYAPPAADPADPDRIDGIRLIRIDPPALRKFDTRSTISVVAQYSFTIL